MVSIKTEALKKNKKAIVYILLTVMIIAQLFIISYVFEVKKEGYHMDEIWSYGLSNSEYKPFLYDRYQNGENNIYNEWVDGKVFHDYLTVQDGEQFSYGSVYYNQTQDVHPPLYYFILNTICSFFPNSFSKWYAFVINIIAFIVSQIFLFKLSRILLKSDAASLGVCAAWGFGVGAVNCFVYLRMYALLLMLVVISAYLHSKILLSDDYKLKALPGIFFVTLSGCLTQYFFIAYAGAMAACFSIFLLCKKKFKKMFIYGGTMLLSVGLAVLIFPAMIRHMFVRDYYIMGINATHGKLATFGLQLHFIFRYMLAELCGIKIDLIQSNTYAYVITAVVWAAAIIAPLCFLFRKENWFKKLSGGIKSFFIINIKRTCSVIRRADKKPAIIVLFILVSSAAVISVVAKVSPIYAMQELSTHYYNSIFPLLILCVFSVLYFIASKLPKIKKVVVPIILCFTVIVIAFSNLNGEYAFLFPLENNGEKLVDMADDAECIVMVRAGGSDIQLFPYDMINSRRVFVTTTPDFKQQADAINQADTSHKVLLMLYRESVLDTVNGSSELPGGIVNDSGSQDKPLGTGMTYEELFASNELTKFIQDNTRFSSVKYIGMETTYGYPFLIYELS